jgi:hypothetical protein
LPIKVWQELKDAADRYSLTGLKKAIEPLESDGNAHQALAAYLRQLMNEGDLDQVSEFLDKINKS